MNSAEQKISRHDVWKMFDRIALRYDLLNRVLSFGRDRAWRKALAKYLPECRNLYLLDLATGTGDQILSLLDHNGRIARAVGIDMAEKMLEMGRRKMADRKLDGIVQLQSGDATAIPFAPETFDVVTMSFGIRNVVNVSTTLAEMLRVLKPGGRALVLEFSLPPGRYLRAVCLWYLRHILPRIGAMISGDSYAYRYLNQTIETFPYGDAFCGLMADAGLQNAKAHPMTFGMASIYHADKPRISS